MSSKNDKKIVFLDRPQPKAFNIPWREFSEPSNPTLRGWALYYGAALVSYVPFLSKFFWTNAGFAVLRNRPELDDVEARYDPTVIKSYDTPVTITEQDRTNALQSMLSEDWTDRTPPSPEYHTILDYHEAYKSGRTTPLAVARSLLPLIRRDIPTPTKHSLAFLQVREALTISAAEASTARYASGQPLSPLDGVPVAIKDEMDVAGYPKTFGSTLSFTREDNATAHCVDLWLRAGAVLLGKTNMHELGSDPLTNNPNHGTPRNPHNSEYYCGGSSGGSAYALATGIVPLAEGNDGGGSIRIPSAYCGLYGLKTSAGRLSTRPACNLAKSTSVAGPMAGNMLDLEIGFRVMGQPDGDDLRGKLWVRPESCSIDEAEGKKKKEKKKEKKVLGVYSPWFDRADGSVQKVCREMMDRLVDEEGWEIREIGLPLVRPEAQSAHAMTILTELLTGINPSSEHFRVLTPQNRLLLAVAQHTTSLDFLQAQRLRNLIMQHLTHLFDEIPGLVIVTPTTPQAGWKIEKGDLGPHGVSDSNMTLRSMEYVHLANFSGCPAITVPAGFVAAEKGNGKVPIGLMGMGEWGGEEELIGFGYDCERVLARIMKAAGETRRPKGKDDWVDVIDLVGRT